MLDPLDDFLDRDFSCDSNDVLRNKLRQQTAHILRRRQRMKWLGVVGLAAACYVAGIATMWLVPQRTVANNVVIVSNEPRPQPAVVAEKKPDPPPPEMAVALEVKAMQQPEGRVENFLKAGNLYLERDDDYLGAVRCYKQALDQGGTKILEASDNDNWLLMSLKNARRWEKRNGD